MDDMELLRDYATRHSEEAFSTLVMRHIDLVYSAALRHTRNHHQAQEITQAVFIALAREAGSLNPRTVLAGWLFQTARLTAANYVRGEIRPARREQEVCMPFYPKDRDEDAWKHVTAILTLIGQLCRWHTALFVPGLTRRVLDWLEPRLDESFNRKQMPACW